MRAKTGLALENMTLAQARETTRQHYAQHVQEFSADEQAAIAFVIDKLRPVLAKKAALFDRTPWRFLKVSDQVEGGLPHTRDNYIVLANGLLSQMVQMHKANPAQYYAQIAGLFVHEQTHVLERANPTVFDNLFSEVFGFRKVSQVQLSSSFVEHNVANPDAMENNWIYPLTVQGKTQWILPYLVIAQGVSSTENAGAFSNDRYSSG